MPKISIIVPIFKVEQYLDRCIQSILLQSFTDYELILVDDGSPDQCGVICDEYAKRDDRIRVIHQENAKLSAARNAGIDIAVGEWVSFIDADDWIHVDYLKILFDGALDNSDVVICDCLNTFGDVEDIEIEDIKYASVTLSEVRANRMAVTRVWGRLIRRSSIGDLRFISGTEPVEDACFNELLFNSNMKIRKTDAKLYYYYHHADSAINSHFGRGVLNAMKPLLDSLDQIKDADKRKRIISRCYKYVFSARYGEQYADDYSDVLKQCNEWLKMLSGYRKELDLRERVIYCVMSRFPRLYRAWRIYDDPTLKEFERAKRTK